jgi:flagellar biosynthesis chaperone FliJ
VDQQNLTIDPLHQPVDQQNSTIDPLHQPVDQQNSTINPLHQPVDQQNSTIDPLHQPVDQPNSTIDPLHQPVDQPNSTINPLHQPVDQPNSTIDPLHQPVDQLEESNNTQTNYTGNVLSVRDVIDLAYQMGIVIKIGLLDGFQFEGIVEKLWDETARILVQKEGSKHRMIIQIDRIAFVLLS